MRHVTHRRPTITPRLRPLSQALHWLGLATAAGAACAQTPAGSPSAVQRLDSVVVTAAGYEQSVREAPASISVIDRETLETQPFQTLNDAVRHLEGISIVGSDTNSRDISIRGMPADYTVILVDGMRTNVRETRTRGGTGGVQSQMIPPLEAIERIEVVRGPMSSLYGADAMGGVINIITKKVPAQWSGAIGLEGTFQSRSELGDSQAGSLYLGGPIKEGLLGVQVYGNHARQDEDRVTGGRWKNRDQALTAKFALTPNKNHDFLFEIGRDELKRQYTPGKSVAALNAKNLPNAGLRSTDERTHWSIAHHGRWSFGESQLRYFREVNKQREINPETGLVSYDGGAEPRLSRSVLDAQVTLPFDRHTLKMGAQYEWTRLSNIQGENASYKNGNQKNKVTQNPNSLESLGRDSWAVFIEDSFQVTDDFVLTGGLRLDKDEHYGTHWTPRLYGVYTLPAGWSVRGGVAKGFRPPTLRQSASGYLTSTGGPSSLPGVLYGNDGLEPETSTSAELGVRYDSADGLSASLTMFQNNIRNKIVSDYSGGNDPRTGAPLYTYNNLEKVRIRGFEAGLTWPFAHDWSLTANYTYTDSKRLGGGETSYTGRSLSGTPLDKTPKHMANLRLDWEPMDGLQAWARANYLGEQYWAAYRNGPSSHVRERKSSTTFDLGARYEVNKHISLTAAVLNLTNRVVPLDGTAACAQAVHPCGPTGNWTVDEGRRFWLGMNLKF